MIVLGIDLATKTVGYTIYDSESQEILCLSYIDISQIDELIYKAASLESTFKIINSTFDIDEVVLESPIHVVVNNADVSYMLLTFTGMIEFVLYKVFNKTVHFIYPNEARNLVGVPIKKKINIPEKEQTFQYVTNTILKEYPIDIEDKSMYDAVDSFVATLAYCIKNGQKI